MKYIHNTEAFGEFEFECDSLDDFIGEVEDIVITHDNLKMPDSIEVEGDRIIGWYDGHKETLGELLYEIHISWDFPSHCEAWVSWASGMEIPERLREKEMVWPYRTPNGTCYLGTEGLEKEIRLWMRKEHPEKEYRITTESLYPIPLRMYA